MWIPQQWPTDVMLLIWTLGFYLTYLSLGSIILYIHTGHISIQNIQLQIIDIFSYGNIILTCIYPINSFIINTQIGEKKI